MFSLVDNPQIHQILTFPDADESDWRADLDRFSQGDVNLTRQTVGENSVKALQRLLIFLGYSTSSGGSFSIDGDFGRGTNRGLAQFLFDQGLAPEINRKTLAYPCTYQTAKANIVAIPDMNLQVDGLAKLLEVAQTAIAEGQVACGSYDEALFHLNSLHGRKFYDSKTIFQRYGEMAKSASQRIARERGVTVLPEWMLAIVKKETDGVVRPRFEQHYLSRLENANPNADLRELRFRSMSFGLGQIMGENFQMVGAPSAFAMFTAPTPEQVYYVGRFLASSAKTRPAVAKTNPTEEDFRTVARFYNGPAYETNHYHESLETWFKTFRELNR